MDPRDRLLQRYHDGVLDRAEQAVVEDWLRADPTLAAYSRRLDGMDAGLRADRLAAPAHDVVAHIMATVPIQPPRQVPRLSLAHVLAAMLGVALVAMASALAANLRPWIPVEGIAAACALTGLALAVAAKPLMSLENGLLARLLARRVAVGDGEVLICRALGVALLVGAAHIAGLWS
jgi:anti-sigma factor RsiW